MKHFHVGDTYWMIEWDGKHGKHVPPKPFTIFKIEQYNANIWRIYYN